MKASIIIPLYNQAEFVHKAIESALAQTTFHDHEIIVVNDGSTDLSPLIAKSYEPAIKVVNTMNHGLASARNMGALCSTGEFILPLDADDWIDPDYLAKTIPLMADATVGVVATDMQRHGQLTDRVVPRGLTLDVEKDSNELPVCSLIRRTAFCEAGGYSSHCPVYEDWNLWISILKRGWKVAVVNEPLFHYLVKPVSMITATHGQEAQYRRTLQRLHPDVFGKIQ